MGSWKELEEAVRDTRRWLDPEKVLAEEKKLLVAREAEERPKFAEAVRSLKKIDAERLLRNVAAVFPDTTVEAIYDFDEAGGIGSNPSVRLNGPEIEEEPDDYGRKMGAVSVTRQMQLSVSSNVHFGSRISFEVWESRFTTHTDRRTVPSGRTVWNETGLDYDKREWIAEHILSVLQKMFPMMDDLQSGRVKSALGLTPPGNRPPIPSRKR